MNEIKLAGCTPEPLMNYLKALGVFRLVAKQKDTDAMLSWHGGHACLHSRLYQAELIMFFEEEYQPTPIAVPWSGGDFFGVDVTGNAGPYKKSPTATKIIEAVLATNSPRLAHFRDGIRTVLTTMADCGVNVKADIEGAIRKTAKANFIAQLRGCVSEDVVLWIDAAAQAEADRTAFNPHLGSGGGNDGNTHFSDNFMQSLWECLPDFDDQRERRSDERPRVEHALFDLMSGNLVGRTGALFDSGAVGGPNATQGLRREFLINPWNFILAIEGCLVFAGGLAKRLGANSAQSPSFPFIAQMTAAGFGSSVLKEYGQYEIWLPTWDRRWTFRELQHFMCEGRVQLGRRPARTGTDYARAVSSLGVSTGVNEFRRCGLIRGRVGGENYFTSATLGTFKVRHDYSVTLLDQIDPWLSKFQSAIRDDMVPARYKSACYRLDQSITEICQGVQPAPLLNVMCELGNIERVLSTGIAFAKKQGIRPLQGLHPQWLKHANDGSREFRLATTLAGLQAKKNVGALRVFLEEVEIKGKYASWSPGNTSAVWSKRSLVDNFAAVFRRRQMEALSDGLDGVPLNSPRPAGLADVLSFLDRETDDVQLASLLWALIIVDWSEMEFQLPENAARDNLHIPFEFGVMRLLVEPVPIVAHNGHWHIGETTKPTTPDPYVFDLLASGQKNAVGLAVDRAARRLKSGGRLVNGYRNRQQAGKSLAIESSVSADRLLAAMLIPLSNYDLELIANTVLYPPESEE